MCVLKGFPTIFVRISQHETLLTTEFGPPKMAPKVSPSLEALIAGLGEEEVDFGLSWGNGSESFWGLESLTWTFKQKNRGGDKMLRKKKPYFDDFFLRSRSQIIQKGCMKQE